MEKKVLARLYKHPVRHQGRGVCYQGTFQDRWTQPAASSREGLVYINEQRNVKFTIWGDLKRTCLNKDTVEWTWPSRWSFLSLPKGVKWYVWGGGLYTAVLQSCGKPYQADKSDESNSSIRFHWFLGVNECCLKHLLELQSASYLQDEQGRPEDQMELGGRFHTVNSPEGATVGREVLNM